MRTLATATGESSDLAILDGADCVYIERVQSSAGVRVLTRIGTRIPAHALAMGKVLLAYLPAGERRRRVSARLQAFTSRTLTSLEELDRECERALLDRFAVNYGEWRPDAGGIAAPIFDRLGCVAAISIDAPLDRLDTPSISTLATLVKNAAAGVSRESGADMAQVGYAFE
jgi:DNA-binding IclR family transcriptional regulator